HALAVRHRRGRGVAVLFAHARFRRFCRDLTAPEETPVRDIEAVYPADLALVFRTGHEQAIAPDDRRGIAFARDFGTPDHVRAVLVPAHRQAFTAGPSLPRGPAKGRPVPFGPGHGRDKAQGKVRCAEVRYDSAGCLGFRALVEGRHLLVT